jgi:glycosyltransferase involved in cell wall biosynthesis
MNKLKVNLLYEPSGNGEPHCCGYVRLLLPFAYETLKRKYTTFTDFSLTNKADIIIGQRVFVRNTNDAMWFVNKVKKEKTCFIYSIDDNLLDLERQYINNSKEIISILANHAYGVIVSTSNLRDRLSALNKNIFIVENSLDDTLINIRQKAPDPLGIVTIGYMGTYTHDKDFAVVQKALKQILNDYPNVYFEIAGAVVNYAKIDLPKFTSLPLTKEDYSYTKFWKWMTKNIFWDIGIAPLEATKFTRCKSDIKFLDYSALGVTGVYSNVPPYSDYVVHNKTGLLAENTAESWYNNLERLIVDTSLRFKLLKNAQEYLRSYRMLNITSEKLGKVVMDMYNNFKDDLNATGNR